LNFKNIWVVIERRLQTIHLSSFEEKAKSFVGILKEKGIGV